MAKSAQIGFCVSAPHNLNASFHKRQTNSLMAFQWQAKTGTHGVEDMVLLTKVNESQIVENLHKRYMADLIYTYIGPVLIAVNPYKSLPYFTEKEIDLYHGSAAHENPPHIYAVAETMFQNMIIDEENQCVIISGESGAGKTESSKLLMNYIAAVSGKGGSAVEETKRIILESNPLLESFGNAKTLRNNNSSRFGKYFEICFSRGGQPIGGNISNFLLEKSRVVGIKEGERNFHIFYHLLKGANADERQTYGVAEPSYFNYLNQSSAYTVEGVNDAEEMKEVRDAMKVCGLSDADRHNLFCIVAGILHLGNITFTEKNGGGAEIVDDSFLEFPAYLFGVDKFDLKQKLTSRLMVTGGAGQRSSAINMNLNVQQATNTRDAFAKAMYTRMFDYIIGAVNKAIKQPAAGKDRVLNLGVLDIYGFEIFDKNGFEQLCINYVNERLQQVFIELTLKSEQEEYVREGIQWTPINYFNNKIVCDLIEGKRPSGVMAVLDDICVQLHGETQGADAKFVQKLDVSVGQHAHYVGKGSFFSIKHYAGTVEYNSDGFCEANKDTLYRDLIILAQSTNNAFIRNLFPEDVSVDDKKRPTTASFKIRNQCNQLVETLMKCTPSYIRCIKPNEKKRAREWDGNRVDHQVRYLNLRENINIRRAGFCYRNTYEKFLKRYGILTPNTFPQWNGSPPDGVTHIMNTVNMDRGQWQLGKSKVFVKAPESLFMLEELRERKFHEIVTKIQRCYRKWKSRKYYLECKKKVLSIVVGKKERRRLTLNRDYMGDYMDIMNNPAVRSLAGKNDKILFADHVRKYDRRWKTQMWDIMVTNRGIILVSDEPIKEGPEKGKLRKVAKRQIPFVQLSSVSLSTKSDDFFVLHVPEEYDNVLENFRKTEMITIMAKAYQEALNKPLNIYFTDSIQYSVKKTTWDRSGSRTLTFTTEISAEAPKVINNSSSRTDIGVPVGLPKDSQPAVKAASQPSGKKYVPPTKKVDYLAAKKNSPPGSPPVRPPLPPTNSYPAPPTDVPRIVGRPPAMVPAPMGQRKVSNNLGVTPQLTKSTPDLSSGGFNPVQNINLGRPALRPAIPVSASNSNFSGSNTIKTASPFRPPPSAAVRPPSASVNNLAAIAATKKAAPPPPKPKVEQCKALYNYEAREADELSFAQGDIITIITKGITYLDYFR